MSKRGYRQVCSVAGALDLIGERWTFLLIRELLTGPKRYADLLESLKGIGTNLLAARLKSLMENRLISQRELPPPAASRVYELTESGFALEPVILELVRWGLQHQQRPPDDALYRPNWSMLAMRALFVPEHARGIHLACQFDIDGFRFFARVEDGTLTTRQGEDRDADVVVTTDESTYRMFERGKSLGALDKMETWQVEGPVEALERFTTLFVLPGAAPEPEEESP